MEIAVVVEVKKRERQGKARGRNGGEVVVTTTVYLVPRGGGRREIIRK